MTDPVFFKLSYSIQPADDEGESIATKVAADMRIIARSEEKAIREMVAGTRPLPEMPLDAMRHFQAALRLILSQEASIEDLQDHLMAPIPTPVAKPLGGMICTVAGCKQPGDAINHTHGDDEVARYDDGFIDDDLPF